MRSTSRLILKLFISCLFFRHSYEGLFSCAFFSCVLNYSPCFKLISTQKDQFKQAITIWPDMLVLPVGMDFDLFTLFNSPTINTPDNTQAVNPLYRYGLQQVEDPEINRLAGEGKPVPWFMMGATEDTAFIEVDYLNGQEVPTIRRMETAGQLGFVWDIYSGTECIIAYESPRLSRLIGRAGGFLFSALCQYSLFYMTLGRAQGVELDQVGVIFPPDPLKCIRWLHSGIYGVNYVGAEKLCRLCKMSRK